MDGRWEFLELVFTNSVIFQSQWLTPWIHIKTYIKWEGNESLNLCGTYIMCTHLDTPTHHERQLITPVIRELWVVDGSMNLFSFQSPFAKCQHMQIGLEPRRRTGIWVRAEPTQVTLTCAKWRTSGQVLPQVSATAHRVFWRIHSKIRCHTSPPFASCVAFYGSAFFALSAMFPEVESQAPCPVKSIRCRSPRVMIDEATHSYSFMSLTLAISSTQETHKSALYLFFCEHISQGVLYTFVDVSVHAAYVDDRLWFPFQPFMNSYTRSGTHSANCRSVGSSQSANWPMAVFSAQERRIH